MAHLKILTASEINAIAAALKPTAPAPSPGPSPAPAPVTGAQCTTTPTVGHVVSHRLNRAEYNNTVRDLFGIQSKPANAFAEDGVAETFNNNANVLYVNKQLAEQYLTAAETVTNEAFQLRRASIMVCSTTDDACSRNILSPIATRAFRRPLKTGELDSLIALVNSAKGRGETFESGIRLALQAVLISPHFLFRVIAPAATAELNHYEMASRLSYFIWSSMPDAELFKLAAEGRLKSSADLKLQVARMLKDPKAGALVENFAQQWLSLKELMRSMPNTSRYPEFNSQLRFDMITETQMFIQNIFTQNLSMHDLVTAQHTFVNASLASLYGLPNVTGTNFRKVSTTQFSRQGILGHASIMTLTSRADETSIIHRGKWVLKNLLCDLPPPPPIAFPPVDPTLSELERSQRRLSDTQCMSCHSKMDPIGTGLQSYNAIGKWRDRDEAGKPIDGIGQFPDGRQFAGPVALSQTIHLDPRFRVCVAKKAMTYALGRELNTADNCIINKIANENVGSNKTFTELIQAVVESQIFRQQGGDGASN